MIGPALAAALAVAQPATEESLTPMGRALVPAGAPATASGVVRTGDELLGVDVRHGVTGVLRQEVRSRGLLSVAKPIPAGSPVYGTVLNDELVWCAPTAQPRKDGSRNWSAVCFPGEGAARFFVPAIGGLFVGGLTIGSSTNAASAVEVEEKAVDFGEPMRLVVTFAGWRRGAAQVDIGVRWKGGRSHFGRRSLPKAADGSSRLSAMGAQLRLRPVAGDPKAAQADVLLPPREDVALLESF